MVLEHRYPALKYLKPAAKRRIPHFVWEYLDSATGDERTKAHNRRSLDSVHFMPAILKGEVEASTQTNLLGQSYDLPFGVAPVGMSGAIWPDAEGILARNAYRQNLP